MTHQKKPKEIRTNDQSPERQVDALVSGQIVTREELIEALRRCYNMLDCDIDGREDCKKDITLIMKRLNLSR